MKAKKSHDTYTIERTKHVTLLAPSFIKQKFNVKNLGISIYGQARG